MSGTIPDCLIVGAGPTGLTLAIELVRRGKVVRIFDRSPGPRPEDQSRALGILPPSLSLLEPSGVTKTLLREGLQIKGVEFRHNGKPHGRLNITKGEGDFPFLLSLPQGRTERILISKLSELGVDVEWNTEIVDLFRGDNLPAIIIKGEGETSRIKGHLVVGCDGVHSVVRKAMNIDFDGPSIFRPFSLADVRLKDELPEASARVDFHPAGPIIQLPMPGGICRLIGTQPEVHKRPEIANLIEREFWVSDFRITFRHVDKLQAGPFFLAGDSAHVHSPVGGRGMNTGIGDAAWLAWLISEGRESEYEAARLPVAQHIIQLTRRLTNLVLANGPVARFVIKRVLPLALRFDFVQRRIAQTMLAQDMPHPPWID